MSSALYRSHPVASGACTTAILLSVLMMSSRLSLAQSTVGTSRINAAKSVYTKIAPSLCIVESVTKEKGTSYSAGILLDSSTVLTHVYDFKAIEHISVILFDGKKNQDIKEFRYDKDSYLVLIEFKKPIVTGKTLYKTVEFSGIDFVHQSMSDSENFIFFGVMQDGTAIDLLKDATTPFVSRSKSVSHELFFLPVEWVSQEKQNTFLYITTLDNSCFPNVNDKCVIVSDPISTYETGKCSIGPAFNEYGKFLGFSAFPRMLVLGMNLYFRRVGVPQLISSVKNEKPVKVN